MPLAPLRTFFFHTFFDGARGAKPGTVVITGFNTDVEYDGVTYHVQTEDKGLDTPLILSLVYVGGAILASKRTPYDDLITSGFDDSVLAERLNRQHKLICAAVRAGRIGELKQMSERDPSSRAAASAADKGEPSAPADGTSPVAEPEHGAPADAAGAAARPLSHFEFPKQMKGAQQKIKDLVTVAAFDETTNIADQSGALAAYHFTDATSDLLARWLDGLADVTRRRGAARALAGARGVGKSHTLATFAALAASPELRTNVADAHVAISARRLMERRYIVIRVERGTRQTLLGEVAAAFNTAFGVRKALWGSNPASMLISAITHASDAIPVIIVDTPFDRTVRPVRDGRDDGPLLSEFAAAAQNINAFIALALDDDIANAIGASGALASAFQVDYLDPEHLYNIIDQDLLRKSARSRSALHEIYQTLRGAVPGFNWSEARFAALYPLHPLVAEVMPAVRQHAPAFSFLSFASMATQRSANRPALSPVLLDEVFDRLEYDLRRSEKLQVAFATYDELVTQAVAQFAPMQRLQAKFLLKCLFILSLDGRGATASELCAALLFYDEASPDGAVDRIDEVLARFAEAAPAGALDQIGDRGETRYSFQLGALTTSDVTSEGAAAAEGSATGALSAEGTSEAVREKAATDALYLTLLDDEGDFRAGELVTMRIYVGHGPENGQPIQDAGITVKVLGTSFRPLIVTTTTGPDGVAIVRALLPRFNSGRAAILIRASAGDNEAELRRIIHSA